MSSLKWCIIRICCLCCLCCFSCSSGRKTTRQHTRSGIDSLRIERNDSLLVRQLLNKALQRTSRLQHISLSPPDSMGRQWAQSATLLTTQTVADTQEEQTIESVAESVICHKAIVAERVSRKRSDWRWTGAAFFVCLFLLLLLWRRKSN